MEVKNSCLLLFCRKAELLAVNADGNMPYDICEDDVTLDYIESEMAKRGKSERSMHHWCWKEMAIIAKFEETHSILSVAIIKRQVVWTEYR